MSESLSELSDGIVGTFLPFNKKSDLAGNSYSGSVRKLPDGIVEVTLLTPESRLTFNPPIPPQTSMAGVTTAGRLLLTGRVAHGYVTRMYNASELRLYFNTALSDIDLPTVKSPKVFGVGVEFSETLRWAGQPTPSYGKHGASGYSIDFPTYHDVGPAVVSHGRELWIHGQSRDTASSVEQVTVESTLGVSCRSSRPLEADQFILPLYHVQTLLSLAWLGYVPATEGDVWFHHAIGAGRAWDRRVMQVPPQAVLARFARGSAFTLKDLGGVDTLGRWARLCEAHPRAIGPVEVVLRSPSADWATLITVAIGMEYWVSANRRTAKWAMKKKRPHTIAHALADRVGSSFGDWVGDPFAWASSFWETYEDLKHDPSKSHDYDKVTVLAQSGRLLLIAALIDRAAGSKTATRQMFSNHRLRQLGNDLRARFP